MDVAHSIYEVPLDLHKQGIDALICEQLNLPNPAIDLSEWEKILDTIKNPKGTITVGIVGKYVQHQDAYKSVFESLVHGALAAGYKLEIERFEADKLPSDPIELAKMIEGCDGYLIPGGFGERGWMGKILAAKHCREKKIPYFGICLGMQVMAVEFARHAVGLSNANSTEFDPDTEHPVISLLSEQKGVQDLGGTMRLGAFFCDLKLHTKAHKAYKQPQISERHRHRYEFNNAYKEAMEKKGFIIAGTLKGESLCEIAEIKDHPWMVGVQFHPEFKSKPTDPHPLFRDFIQAMITHHKGLNVKE
jgi:CTP synthase